MTGDHPTGRALTVTSAGTVTGDSMLGVGSDTFELLGGSYTGNIYGDRFNPLLGGDISMGLGGADRFNWVGGSLVGGFYGEGGSDIAAVSANGYDGTQTLDGGDDTSVADGMIDTLTLSGISAAISGDKLVNWEIINVDASKLRISGGTWVVGMPSETATGVSLSNGSSLEAMGTFDLLSNLRISENSSFAVKSSDTGHVVVGGTVTSAGIVTLKDGHIGDVLEIEGDFVGHGGTLLLDSFLGGDRSGTDQVRIAGDANGNTLLTIANVGGGGAKTNKGIQLVTVGGQSSASAFTLDGDYEVDGSPALVAGAYAYRLYRGTNDGGNITDWYLRSELKGPVSVEAALFQAGAPVYEAYPQVLLGMSALPTLQQRVGGPYASEAMVEQHGLWGRIESESSRSNGIASVTGVDFDQRGIRLEVGDTGTLHQNEQGRLVGEASLHTSLASARVASPHNADEGPGKITTHGHGIGAVATWYGDNGLYFDAQGRATWFSSALSYGGAQSLASWNDSFGYGLSLENGSRLGLSEQWSLTPQAQVMLSSVSFQEFTDSFGSIVSSLHGNSLEIRLGASFDYETSWEGSDGSQNSGHFYGVANVYSELLGETAVAVGGVALANQSARSWGGLAMGGAFRWGDGKYSVYGHGHLKLGVENPAQNHSLAGRVGINVNW